MDMALQQSASPSSSSSSSSTAENGGAAPSLWPLKRPAGRTKFRETRHPVFRGVRRRGSAGRWVCEVRVPGQRGTRLWLGSYVTADAAARAHDVAMLMLRGHGRSTACLNFPDSAWLLVVPPAFAHLADVRRAAVQAVEDFQRRREAASASASAEIHKTASRVSEPSSAACSAGSSETSADAAFEAPKAALDSFVFELDWQFRETEFDVNYYASLAQGLLIDPPAAGAYSWDSGEWGGDATDVALWSY